MAEAFVNMTEGAGKKAHAWDRVIGANTVLDEFVLPGEFPYPSYIAAPLSSTSVATANDHLLQLMAGSSLNVRIRRIHIEQANNATAAGSSVLEIWRLSSAGSGGTAITPAKLNLADSAAGATAMTQPSAKGTESVMLMRPNLTYRQALPASGTVPDDIFEWVALPNQEPLIIPAGAANGIALKNLTATAGATVAIWIEFVETAFV